MHQDKANFLGPGMSLVSLGSDVTRRCSVVELVVASCPRSLACNLIGVRYGRAAKTVLICLAIVAPPVLQRGSVAAGLLRHAAHLGLDHDHWWACRCLPS